MVGKKLYMAQEHFSFAAPLLEPHTFVPNFDVFHDPVQWHAEKTELPTTAGRDLLEACQKENWTLVSNLLHMWDKVWETVDGQAEIRAAVNTQDPVSDFLQQIFHWF